MLIECIAVGEAGPFDRQVRLFENRITISGFNRVGRVSTSRRRVGLSSTNVVLLHFLVKGGVCNAQRPGRLRPIALVGLQGLSNGCALDLL